jgi:succinoglycan biosynthesis transport protein ExoP
MLDRTPNLPPDTIWPATASATEMVTLIDAVRFVQRQFWVIAGTTLAAMVLALLYIAVTPAEYVASSQLLIAPGKEQALWQGGYSGVFTIDSAQVESQVAVLQSERTANDVIGELKLADDPEFSPSGALSNYERQRTILGRFERALSARRIGQSYVIEVSFRSPNPEKAAKITNAVIAAYLRDQQNANGEVTRQWVITPASQPLAKAYPKSRLVLLAMTLMGLVLGIAIAGARSILDGSVRGAAQIRALGLPCLGLLPAYGPARRNGASPRVEIVDAPLSPFSDAVRNIKVSVQNASRDRPGLCLGIMSLQPGEGASTVALNLAASIGGSGAKTLLVDGDFRHRTLSRRLSPGARWGLVEALRNGQAEAAVINPKSRVYLLPLAEDAPIANSEDLLGSQAMQDLLPRLKEQFATIIVDLPALSSTVDGRVAAPLLDGCILVAAHRRTPLRALESAVELLRSDDVALLGVVINQVSEGIPPLFGLRLDDIRGFGYARYFGQLVRAVR